MQPDLAQYNLYSKAYFQVIYDVESQKFGQIKDKIQNFIKGFAPKDPNQLAKKGK